MNRRQTAGLLLSLLIALMCLGAGASEETPTLGFAGKTPPAVGQRVKLLVNHASYPQLADFDISVTYLGPLPQTDQLGHPDNTGALYWTPRYGGRLRLLAVAPGSPPLEISRELRLDGPQAPPTWLQLSGLSLGLCLSILLIVLYRRRLRRLYQTEQAHGRPSARPQ